MPVKQQVTERVDTVIYYVLSNYTSKILFDFAIDF